MKAPGLDSNILTVPPCPVCGTSAARRISRKAGWSYYRCAPCSLVFIHPQPTPEFLTAQYQDYLPEREEAVRAWRLSIEEVISKSASLIEGETRGPGRILDVGCGYGFFLDYMAERGWRAEGIEISETGRRYAAAHYPRIRVRLPGLPDPEIPKNSYDAVTLFYVLEHLADPVGILREVFRILKPGGILLLRWPHTTPIVRLLGPLARNLDLYHTPYHLFDYSPAFIRRTLTGLGFGPVRTLIAGNTHPVDAISRGSSFLFGGIGEFLSRATNGRLLLSGVSKTTLARKSGRRQSMDGKITGKN